MRAVLSLGSNLDDRVGLLRSVYEDFAESIVASSPVYATAPWGVKEQGEFLNAVIIVELPDDVTPMDLLRRGQGLEESAHRRRVRHWGPRTLDVDIVDIEGYTSLDPQLMVPHPYAHQRAFVLVPWLAADLDATLKGVALAELIARLDPSEVAGVRELGSIDELGDGS